MLQVRQPRIGAQVSQHLIKRLAAAGDGAVDTLVGQQQGAACARCDTAIQQGLAQLVKILQRNKLVKRGNNDLIHNVLQLPVCLAAAATLR